jgi:formylglycine-generating enzyme required for sulfatase activity
VTWYEAAQYCNWLSRKEGLPQAEWCYLPNAAGGYAEGMRLAANYRERRGYRLPTEAEWEFACRAGTASSRFFGTAERYLEYYAVFDAVSSVQPLPVGLRKPNDFGLFDMLGNAAEWCQDVYRPYRRSDAGQATDARDDGTIRDRDARVLRGGCFADPPALIRCAARDKEMPASRNPRVGFRVARGYP